MRWEAGSEHELFPLAAIGLNLIYAGLLEPADGTTMPTPQDAAELADALHAVNLMIVHAQRPTTTADGAIKGPPHSMLEYRGPEILPKRYQ